MKKTIFFTLLCVFTAPVAMADLLVVETGGNPWTGVTVYSALGYKGGVYAGVYQLTVTGSDSGAPGVTGAVDAFCIDIADFAPTSSVNYTVKSLSESPDAVAGEMGEVRAKYLAKLLDTYWTDWSDSGNSFSSTGIDGTYTKVEVAAALQLAVWEVVDEFNTGAGVESITPTAWTVNSVTDRQFSASCSDTNVIALANGMLGYIDNFTVEQLVGLGSYVALAGGDYQDYVVRVPVPAAALLGMLGLSAAGLRLRRRV